MVKFYVLVGYPTCHYWSSEVAIRYLFTYLHTRTYNIKCSG